MILDNIGYVICESPNQDPERKFQLMNEDASEFKTNGKLHAITCLQTMGEINRNNRCYLREDLEPQLTSPRIKELLFAKTLLSELGHPLDTSLSRQSQIRQDLCCNRILKLWTEGDDIMAEVVATNNQHGAEFDADLREGVIPAYSLRALGEIRQERGRALVKNIRVITWDCVIYPSHPHAYMRSIVSEGVDLSASDKKNLIVESADGTLKNSLAGDTLVVPFDKEQVLNFIQQESANLKFIREMFDFVYNDIELSKNGSKVWLTDKETGSRMAINVESYIHNEIANSLFDYDQC